MLSNFVNLISETGTVDSYPITLRIFTSLYFLWGVIWTLVAYHYGKASRSSWKDQGGTWGRTLPDLWTPYKIGWKILFLKPGSEDPLNKELPSRYTVGHYLRFSIFLGAVSPLLVLILADSTERAPSTWIALFSILVYLVVSLASAMGHLYIAYRMNPFAWMRIIVVSTIWVLFAPLVFTSINWP